MTKIILFIIAYFLIGIINYKLDKLFKKLPAEFQTIKGLVIINEKINNILLIIIWPVYFIVGMFSVQNFKAGFEVGSKYRSAKELMDEFKKISNKEDD